MQSRASLTHFSSQVSADVDTSATNTNNDQDSITQSAATTNQNTNGGRRRRAVVHSPVQGPRARPAPGHTISATRRML